ncbi:Glyceraldehyde 3-phosphate phosphatase, partial [Bienertia sinuspersici]
MGCSDAQYFEELYNYFMTDKAWKLCDPNAEKVFQALRKVGVQVAVFDDVAVSAEVAAEKPNPTIFLKVYDLLGVKPEDAVHVGDDRSNDIRGARDAGCDAWLRGGDVHSFK